MGTRALCDPPLPEPPLGQTQRAGNLYLPAAARPAAGERPGHAPPKPEAGEAFVVLLSCPVRPRGVRVDAVPEFGSNTSLSTDKKNGSEGLMTMQSDTFVVLEMKTDV